MIWPEAMQKWRKFLKQSKVCPFFSAADAFSVFFSLTSL
jgi:hypothetical protein